jgi:DNA-binding protein HU-beta
MATPSLADVAQALAELVQEALMRGESIYVPGIGTFSVEHHGSTTEQLPDGRLVLHPPRDVVSFTSEATLTEPGASH